MTAETYAAEVEDAWPEVLTDSREVLEHARQTWRDEDREVPVDDDYRDDS